MNAQRPRKGSTMRRRGWMKALTIAPIALAAVAVVFFIAMSLWNWLMPELFGLKPITFWQTAGLLVLSRLLLGGFRGRSGPRHWRHRMMERWEKMTPEERERFREGLRNGRCGPFAPPADMPADRPAAP